MLLLLGGSVAPGLQPECLPDSLPDLSLTATNPIEGELESELLALTNQQRERQGLPALESDENLARIARDQAIGMARQGFISHEQPSGDLKTRMASKGYIYATARENVASASTVGVAQKLLSESPAHRDNILAADVDRVGIGVVRYPSPCGKQLYITEIFATARREYQPAEVQNVLLRLVNDLRQNGAGALVADPILEKLASDSVQSMNVPINRQELQNLLADSAGELKRNGRTEISRVNVNVQLLHDPQKVSIPNEGWIGKQARSFGSAVRPVVDSQNQPAFLVLTLIAFTNQQTQISTH